MTIAIWNVSFYLILEIAIYILRNTRKLLSVMNDRLKLLENLATNVEKAKL